ncbi:EpsG family protein [Pseudomonas kitaguniensis]|uniref:EpsG family protein n=1 Tax=Pseudomonas kitaguniensis TaxID=2607908 RepID=UPI003D08F5FA
MFNTYSFFAMYLAVLSGVEVAIDNVRLRKFCFFLLGIVPLTLFVGLRGGDVDDDYYSYIKYFELAPTLSNFAADLQSYEEQTSSVEKGFSLVASLLASVGASPEAGIFLFALVNFLFLYWIITRYSINYYYSLFIYYCLFLPTFFTHIRFSLALVVGFYALMRLLVYRRKLLSWLLLVASPFMHIAAIIYIPTIIAYRWLSRVKIVHFGVAILLLSGVFLFVDFSAIIGGILSYVGGRYEFYVGAGTGSIISAALRVLFLFLFLLGFKGVQVTKFSEDSLRTPVSSGFNIVFFIYCLSTVVWSIGWQVDVLYRLGLALQFSMVLLVPYYIYYRTNQSVLSYLLVGASAGLFNIYFLYTLAGGVSVLGDYQTLFSAQ